MKVNALTSLILTFVLIGCSSKNSPSASNTNEPSNAETPKIILPAPTITITPSVSEYAEANFPEGCIRLTKTSFDSTVLNGLLVVQDNEANNYFLDPKTSQLLGIGGEIQKPSFISFPNIISPNKKFMQASDLDKGQEIIRTTDKIIKTYVPDNDWNRGRWLDNEHIFYQHWHVPHGNEIVIYNPFTGEQKNIELDLPNPYIVIDGGGTAAWVKADIDPSLKQTLYNDKDGKLILWDLNTQKEMASLPASTDLSEGKWSPDGEEFAIATPSQTSDIPVASELFAIEMDGTVTKLTSLNQKFPFASIGYWPSWSPDGRHIGFWLRVNPNLQDRWLAIIDTETLETQLYCLMSRTSGGDIVWSPNSEQVIVNQLLPAEKMQSTLVDLNHQTQTTLDTKGLQVNEWMSP